MPVLTTAEQIEAMIAGMRISMPMQKICAATGLSRATLYRLAAGAIRRPSHDTVQRLLGAAENKSAIFSDMRQKPG